MKRILALITIVILVGLYIVTLVAAIAGTPNSNTLFMGALIASVLLPVLLFAIFHTYDLLKSLGEKRAAKEANAQQAAKDANSNIQDNK